jgi:hypothetical protein
VFFAHYEPRARQDATRDRWSTASRRAAEPARDRLSGTGAQLPMSLRLLRLRGRLGPLDRRPESPVRYPALLPDIHGVSLGQTKDREDITVTVDGRPGDDAKHYQEKQVHEAIMKSRGES